MEPRALLTLPHIAAAVITYWIAATAYHFFTAPKIPTNIPWMGYGKGWLAGIRNFFAVTKSKEWVIAGYERHGRKGEVFVLPPSLGMPPEIVMPRNQLAWMFDQPDRILSTSEAHYDVLHGYCTFIDPFILADPYHEHVIHKNLVRQLNAILPDLEEEVPDVIANIYGTDTKNWVKLDVMDSFMKMIPVLTNRMLVGAPLCRNPKFLDAVLKFTLDCVRIQGIMVIVPKAFQPVVGRLLSLANWYHYWLSSRFTLPMIKQRISDIVKKDAGHPDYANWKEPNDFITWSYRTAQAEGRRDEMQPDRIAQRIMPVNFASIHTTSLTTYDVIVNVLQAGPEVIRQLREEAYHILREEGGYTRQGLSRMHRFDSAIRESQRLSPIALTFLTRKVVAKEGITLPTGVHVEYGTMLSVPWTPIAGDTELHDKPEVFDAFRYSRPREEYEAMSPEEKEKVDMLKLKQTGLVTTGTHHLPFGHGRHACPGRFFVSQELKMVFSHLLLHYDFKPMSQKPGRIWVIRYQVPLAASIEARRRETMWTPADE